MKSERITFLESLLRKAGLDKIRSAAAPDAIKMLVDDHRRVEENLELYENTDDRAAKNELIEQTVRELLAHITVEEELIYPAIWGVNEMSEKIDQSFEEHHCCREFDTN